MNIAIFFINERQAVSNVARTLRTTRAPRRLRVHLALVERLEPLLHVAQARLRLETPQFQGTEVQRSLKTVTMKDTWDLPAGIGASSPESTVLLPPVGFTVAALLFC